ncbi:MAG: protein kinase [Merismopediaceae bacterium]|nr:protein kinase [Merismopediaceae bacterium]
MNSPIKPGKLLNDRYLIQLTLGQGRFSRTYLADDTHRFHEPCIIKEFALQMQDAEMRHTLAKLFERQAEMLYRLYHPQMANFREFFRLQPGDKSGLFLVQDYVEGETYQNLLTLRRSQRQKFSPSEVIEFLQQVLPILQYLHGEGVVHRHISLEHLIQRELDDLPVLINFGSIKEVPTVPGSSSAKGAVSVTPPPDSTTPGETPPKPPSFSQDFYGLAIAAIALLTGKDYSRTVQTPGDWPEILKPVMEEPSLHYVLLRMLTGQPAGYFAQASDILTALTSPPPPPPPIPDAIAPAPAQPPTPVPEIPAEPRSEPISGAKSPPTVRQGREKVRGCFTKLLVLISLMAISGIGGWFAGKYWLSLMFQSLSHPTPSPLASSSPEAPDPSPNGDSPLKTDLDIKNAIRSQRLQLGIDRQFLNDLIEARRQPLQSQTQPPATDTSQWNQTAQELLAQLATLSPDTLKPLGQYTLADRDALKPRVNQLYLSSRSLNSLVNARFLSFFPDQDKQDLPPVIETPLGQVWTAIALDTLKNLEARTNYQLLTLDNNETPLDVTGQLTPGTGQAYALSLPEGKFMEVKLDAPADTLISVYSPTGQETLLENARLHQWSGLLNEAGYYEFVVTSLAKQPSSFQLKIRVW